jgi:predicted enzyme related to lactoylglutathione lyase
MTAAENSTAHIGNVLHPVTDVSAAAGFYGRAFGFATKFVDGDRYAALDGGSITLALAGAAEDVTGGRAAVSIKVPDVQAAVDAVVQAGGSILTSPETGPHEMRAVVLDPWENALVIYGTF